LKKLIIQLIVKIEAYEKAILSLTKLRNALDIFAKNIYKRLQEDPIHTEYYYNRYEHLSDFITEILKCENSEDLNEIFIQNSNCPYYFHQIIITLCN